MKGVVRVEAFLSRLFIILLLTLLIFVLADRISIRFLTSRSPVELMYRVQAIRQPKPYVMFGGTPNVEGMNSLGYRGPVPARPKPPGEFRIIVLGGSTVFLGEPPLPELLELEFKRNGMDSVKVYNFGVVSSVSGMELARLVFEVPAFEPNLVVLYNGGNDLMHPWRHDPRPGYPFNFLVYENNPVLESDVRTYPLFPLMAYGSNILRAYFPGTFVDAFVPLERLKREAGWGLGPWVDRIAETYVDHSMKAEAIAGCFGSDLVVFFQPTVFYKNPLSPEESRFVSPEGKAFMDLARKRVIEEFGQRSGGPDVIDLTGLFNGIPKRVFEDHVHVYREGNLALARALHDHIVDRVRHPRSAASK